MTARDGREAKAEAAALRSASSDFLGTALETVTCGYVRDWLNARANAVELDRVASAHITPDLSAALADDPAQATLARVEALADQYARWSSPLQPDMHPTSVARAIRAALVPGHDHEGGK